MTVEPGGWESWSWDESLFAGAAPYYTKGRLPYAPGLADELAAALTLDGRGRLLDVGCGPGVVTLLLAHLFEEAVGLDPDAAMLAEAARQAAARGIANARWVRMRAEELPGDVGSFRVVTFGASFHWLDRPRVAAAVKRLLDPGGAAVQVDAPGLRPDAQSASSQSGLPHPLPPEELIDALRKRYLGPDRRAGRGIRNTSPSGEDAVFGDAGFLPAQTVMVPDGRVVVRTIDEVVAGVFSSSWTVPSLFGAEGGSFERELRDVLEAASPSGLYSVRLPDNRLSIWRLRQP